ARTSRAEDGRQRGECVEDAVARIQRIAAVDGVIEAGVAARHVLLLDDHAVLISRGAGAGRDASCGIRRGIEIENLLADRALPRRRDGVSRERLSRVGIVDRSRSFGWLEHAIALVYRRDANDQRLSGPLAEARIVAEQKGVIAFQRSTERR